VSRFRIAPTPSGYLHQGNALNFVLTWWQARLRHGEVGLRIDDHDETRSRATYIEDIFRTLEWLELDWDFGATGVEDFKKNYSQTLKKDYYFSELCKENLPLFGCFCSRQDLKKNGGIHPVSCRKKARDFKAGDGSWRLHTGEEKFRDANFRDCILWRRDDLPSYQWVSLIEDRDDQITHLVRGADLISSTEFQQYLAKRIGAKRPEHFFHHDLIKLEGKKLSKTQKSHSIRSEFKRSEDFYGKVISAFVGEEVRSASELLNLKAPKHDLFLKK
jgi:glutamyl-tRNA synthetase